MAIKIGNMVLDGFEAPAGLQFGGRQSIAVHRLAGGGRIVDILGSDEADISWSGIFRTDNGVYRARLLDALRRDGNDIDLIWDSFSYRVIIAELNFDFSNPWWIKYDIRCVISELPSVQSALSTASQQSAVLSDLISASAFFDVSFALSASMVADTSPGNSSAYATASNALAALTSAIAGHLATTTIDSATIDILGLTTTTGLLAKLAAADGFVARAAANQPPLGRQ